MASMHIVYILHVSQGKNHLVVGMTLAADRNPRFDGFGMVLDCTVLHCTVLYFRENTYNS